MRGGSKPHIKCKRGHSDYTTYPDGHRYCRTCKLINDNARYYSNHESELKRLKLSYQKNKHSAAINTDRSRKKHPEKYSAREALRSAVKGGKLKRLPCERCGEVKSHGHHPDYSKPLEVMWLCATHHMELHRKRTDLLDRIAKLK